MKKLLVLFIVLITGLNSVYPYCSSSGMQFFPKQKEISLNSLFIIQGYSNSYKTIASFKNRMVFLESESGEIIELILQEILNGRMYLTQALFKPIKELNPSTKYFLKYSNQTEKESNEMKQWNSEKNEREIIYWKTSNKRKIELLNSNLEIIFQDTSVIHYGCGPSACAIFSVINKSKTEIWYKTEVVDISTSEKTTFYISDWDGTLFVGHGMCSGAFTFKKNGKYKVRFTPINIEGKSIKTTNWKIFESPYMNDKSPYKTQKKLSLFSFFWNSKNKYYSQFCSLIHLYF